MKEISNFRWRLWIRPMARATRVAVVAPVLLAGCLCRDCGGGAGAGGGGLFDKCSTIPAGAIPQPIGTHTNEIISRQVTKAEMDQFVIYLYEWQGDSANFGPFGSRHIERMATRLPSVSFPVILEPDCDTGINEARRLTVVAYLEQHGVSNAGQIVRLGYPQAEGLYGEEAPRIFRQMLVPQFNNAFNTFGNQNFGSNLGGIGGFQTGIGGLVR